MRRASGSGTAWRQFLRAVVSPPCGATAQAGWTGGAPSSRGNGGFLDAKAPAASLCRDARRGPGHGCTGRGGAAGRHQRAARGGHRRGDPRAPGGARGDRRRGSVRGRAPTRATGTPGHENSVDYVTQRSSPPATTRTSSRSRPTSSSRRPPRSRRTADPPTSATTARTASGTPPTSPATATRPRDAVAVDFTEPTDQASASSSGCEAEDFGPDVSGKIVLLQRGTCDFGLKAEIAGAAGAVGAVIFNEGTIGADDRNNVADPDAGRLHRHHPGGRHRLRDGSRAGRPRRRHRPARRYRQGRRHRPPGRPDEERDRRDARRSRRPHGRRRRAPRLRVRGPGHQRRRIGQSTLLETAMQMAELARSAQQGPVHLLQRRGAGPARLGLLRLAADEEADPGHLRDARLRHARVAATTRASSTTATATSRASPARTARA